MGPRVMAPGLPRAVLSVAGTQQGGLPNPGPGRWARWCPLCVLGVAAAVRGRGERRRACVPECPCPLPTPVPLPWRVWATEGQAGRVGSGLPSPQLPLPMPSVWRGPWRTAGLGTVLAFRGQWLRPFSL